MDVLEYGHHQTLIVFRFDWLIEDPLEDDVTCLDLQILHSKAIVERCEKRLAIRNHKRQRANLSQESSLVARTSSNDLV